MKKRSISILVFLILIAITGSTFTGCTKKPAVKTVTDANGKTLKKVTIGQNGGICQAPLIIAYEKGFYQEEGLSPELIKGDYNSFRDMLATGKLDVTDGLVATWLKPIEGGLDINFVLGIHTGCVSILTAKNSQYNKLADLKGKTIGISGGIGGGSMNLAYRAMYRDKLDVKDFQFKDYPNDQLITALEKGDVQAIVIGDQLGTTYTNDGRTKTIRSSALDSDFKDEYCCLLGIRGQLVREDPETAKAIVRAVIKGANWVKDHKKETAQIMSEKKYVNGSPEYLEQLLNNYNYKPSISGGQNSVRVSIDEFKKLGVLDKNLDTKKETDKVFHTFNGLKDK
ncbi:MAG: ABC transporter substrate-binding protein [Bacillota bacterium]|nr:ABC transporter substrate-binding protein [Bacillota bacterium]